MRCSVYNVFLQINETHPRSDAPYSNTQIADTSNWDLGSKKPRQTVTGLSEKGPERWRSLRIPPSKKLAAIKVSTTRNTVLD